MGTRHCRRAGARGGGAQAAIWNEVDDAGSELNPQAIAGSGISGFAGNIGDAGDTEDAFLFWFGGGAITFTGLVGDAALPNDPMRVGLFMPPPEPGFPTDPMTPDDFNPETFAIGFYNLAAGNYIVEAFKDGADPPFTITLSGPNTGSQPTVSAPVPEPATLLLVGAALAGLAWRRKPR